MKADVIVNGSIRLVLIPENDLEKAALKQLSQGAIDGTIIDKQTQILDKVIHDGLVIKPHVSPAHKTGATIIRESKELEE